MISFIVPVLNGLELTRAFVESVRATNPDTAMEWVIVDSGSTDGTLEYAAGIGARIAPFRSTPFNYCAAVNAGAAAATGDLWIIANNDLLFRSFGDLARLQHLYREWPWLAVVSPGRPHAGVEPEFRLGGVNGATWAVRANVFRKWGGMPEALSGYGYDEAWTALQCWKSGVGNAWLSGWDVLHLGSRTFGPMGGNVSPALRRNLSRLLAVCNAADLDHPRRSPDRILDELRKRALSGVTPRFTIPGLDDSLREEFGVAGAAAEPRPGAWRVWCEEGDPRNWTRQWLPWLENERVRDPNLQVVGGKRCFAFAESFTDDQARSAAAALTATPREPPVRLPAISAKRPTPRQRLAAILNDWRRRGTVLPEGW